MANKFDFFEIVVIIKPSTGELDQIGAAEGTVLGMAQDEFHRWVYSVAVPPDHEVWCIAENLLEYTGRFSKSEDFYDGTTLKATVDPRTGKGRLKSRE